MCFSFYSFLERNYPVPAEFLSIKNSEPTHHGHASLTIQIERHLKLPPNKLLELPGPYHPLLHVYRFTLFGFLIKLLVLLFFVSFTIFTFHIKAFYYNSSFYFSPIYHPIFISKHLTRTFSQWPFSLHHPLAATSTKVYSLRTRL